MAAFGTLFGFDCGLMAAYGCEDLVKGYGLGQLLFGHALFGCGLGATAGMARWWKRGLFGGFVNILFFGNASGSGSTWLLEELLLTLEGLTASLFIAFLTDSLSTGRTEPTCVGSDRPWRGLTLTARGLCSRLAEEQAFLEHLDVEREFRRDPAFGRITEERIVWGELLDLELQDLDEQLDRICETAGDALPRQTTLSRRQEGGRHELEES